MKITQQQKQDAILKLTHETDKLITAYQYGTQMEAIYVSQVQQCNPEEGLAIIAGLLLPLMAENTRTRQDAESSLKEMLHLQDIDIEDVSARDFEKFLQG